MNTRDILRTVTITFIIAYLVWDGDGYEPRRIVADLSAAERQAVFESTIASFKKLCLDRNGEGLEKYCVAQRDFLVLFSECDRSCRQVLAKVEQVPTR